MIHTTSGRIFSCLLAAGLVFSTTACSQKAAETSANAEPEKADTVIVETKKPEIGDLTRSTEFIGTIEPDELVSVLPKVSGTVMTVYGKVGDQVKKGDLLFEIDPVDINLQLAAQKAGVDAAQAAVLTAQAQVDQSLGSGFDLQVAQLETQVQAAKNQYSTSRQSLRDYNDGQDVAVDQYHDLMLKAEDTMHKAEQRYKEAKADSDANPGDELLKTQAETYRNAWERAETDYSMARANYNELDDDDSAQGKSLRTAVKNAQLSYDSSNTIYELTKDDVRNDALKVANAQLGQAAASFEAQVKTYEAAAKQLEYTKVYSPIDGVIEGCNVTENGMATNSNPAYTVTNKSTVIATFYVPAEAAVQMYPGDKITVENGRSTYNGTLVETGSMTDPQTGLFKVKASVENGNDLMTGLAVKIVAETSKASQSLLIPQSALYYEEGKPYVYVMQDGKAVRTNVETGVANNDVTEIVSGITMDSDLIVTWNPNLRDGVAIEVKTAESTSSAAASSEASIEASSEASVSGGESASQLAASSEVSSQEASAS